MNSFASIQISLTNLILKLFIQNNFYFEMRFTHWLTPEGSPFDE